ncbi:MAG: hypothetical protein HY330_06980 [Chloroflexi bacterium]|nr:hypothetical protein [Chloroflexota bacterium]
MPTIEVTIDLPFYLRVENTLAVLYEQVCQEAQLQELKGQRLIITFSRRPAGAIDKSGPSDRAITARSRGLIPLFVPKERITVAKERTTVAIKVQTASTFSKDHVGTFAIVNCLEILNRIIASYQATTMEFSNAGFIFPLGISDMQLFAEIRVNGKDIRDRWPSHNIYTFPLSADEAKGFKRYLTGEEALPLSRLFLTNATLSLNRGQYPLAVLQAATAVELKVTQIVSGKLRAAGWSDQAVEPYERMTLGQKLQIPQTDPRSLETYFRSVSGFIDMYKWVRDDLAPLRNRVAHRGYLASLEEAKSAVEMAHGFLKIVT